MTVNTAIRNVARVWLLQFHKRYLRSLSVHTRIYIRRCKAFLQAGFHWRLPKKMVASNTLHVELSISVHWNVRCPSVKHHIMLVSRTSRAYVYTSVRNSVSYSLSKVKAVVVELKNE